ncbi:hypothetical protein BABINDRAFT_162029 [Babjeviella inositovora NRRL Y-12698]|uniref:Pseudouridine synthase I TruA alpha/beta domain-containing protein n=1 Tax=Babjeviella inositovora NRRL Y-12698 TaxID=984486 RepID=A0A1E3QRI7_9ASCO|nr:uncharacterized protein BABINDRAFT_162029 [Babjeviella inositovora NRRL Y-12698]ODQ79662.1 hypothetical protein BABINDRAFT_162029 [Babjeviella inositovora NRRL Y-12698]
MEKTPVLAPVSAPVEAAPSIELPAASAWTEKVDYTKWSKRQLLIKVMELEGKSSHEISRLIGMPVTESKHNTLPVASRKQKEFDFSKYHTRYIVLRFAYLGWDYSGLAFQREPTPLPTVEDTLFEALHKCRLIPSMEPTDFQFSRCGRTDRGVSAMHQVVSLRVRSKFSPEEQADPANNDTEIDYVNILNNLLPKDIKVSGVCLSPPETFDARFSCEWRHYKYIFHSEGLDISRMNEAARKYEGEHDFRNFCKLDGSKQIKNFRRTMLSAQILPLNEGNNDNWYVFDLRGTAFLWHQVRCMVAVLFLVGQKLEAPLVVDYLLDVVLNPCRPYYDMASDTPLILFDCKYPDEIQFTAPPMRLEKHNRTLGTVRSMWMEANLKKHVNDFMLRLIAPNPEFLGEKIRVNLGDGNGRPVGVYEPMCKKKTTETVEVANKKWMDKHQSKKRKMEARKTERG